MYDSDSTSGPVEEIEERVRLQGQLVIDGFTKLMTKYDHRAFVRPDQAAIQEVTSTLSIDERNPNEALLDRLISYLLPLLARQLSTVPQLLDPKGLRKEPRARLQLIDQFQPELDHTMSQIASIMAFVSPQPLHSSDRADDQHLKRFKSFRTNDLNDNVSEIRNQVSSICRSACVHLEQLDLSLVSIFMDDSYPAVYQDLIAGTLDYIDFTIKCLDKSELNAAEKHWEGWIHQINFELDRSIVSVVSSTALYHLHNEDTRFGRELVIHLTELVIPIIKLSRLFFNKLSRRGMNSKPLASSTGMNSQQIRCLSESAHAVWMTIAELLNLLDKANKAPEADPVYTWGITQEIKNLASQFEAPLLIAVLYLVPLIPERDPDHNYYRDWFATWNTQMVLATNRFLHVARSTDRIPS
ncbi:hypothetical protein PSTG_02251 [Puccinia striiformis f. sp. tritici PST-78]|uniref:Uncharacterized protein n=2 Tax=Puccinia striiformis TaxID=27350 RepID=A0A0L0VZS5_9BASI|nr:hypothetical protein PSTG_02251 [Puccinia striiformis f. sp. tritici PST-78]